MDARPNPKTDDRFPGTASRVVRGYFRAGAKTRLRGRSRFGAAKARERGS